MSVRDCILLMAKETPDKLADMVENIISEHHALLKKVAQNSTSTNTDIMQCLCESCKNDECNGMFADSHERKHVKFKVYECNGYMQS
jgi:hypothetical protein